MAKRAGSLELYENRIVLFVVNSIQQNRFIRVIRELPHYSHLFGNHTTLVALCVFIHYKKNWPSFGNRSVLVAQSVSHYRFSGFAEGIEDRNSDGKYFGMMNACARTVRKTKRCLH